MKRRGLLWLLLIVVVAVCGTALWIAAHWRARSVSSIANLMRRVPSGDAVVLYADFQAMRQSGVLDLLVGSRINVEPEYKTFVEQTGFDYRRDLGFALVAFQPKATYLLLQGTFNWKSLNTYARGHGGTCRNTLCRMPGSTLDRNISFFPLRSDIMALAVSPDEWAAANMQQEAGPVSMAIPAKPVWLYVPGSRLQNPERLPSGTQLFAKAMQAAENVLFTMGPQGDRLEVAMEVSCRSPHDAEVLQNQLEGITSVLKAIIASEKQKPNPQDLSGVLTAGAFSRQDKRVIGRWPLDRAFLESLAGTT